MSRIQFLNVSFDNLSMDEAVVCADALICENRSAFIATPNIDHMVLLENNPALRDAYAAVNLILTDGMPIIWFSKLFGTPIKEKISGSDFFPRLCKLAAEKHYKMFFLGAAEGVAELAAEKLKTRFAGLEIVGCYAPPAGFENCSEEMAKIDALLNNTKPHILIVALGCPKQEILIQKNRTRWNIPLSIGVGATLDFAAGKMKRAPRWMSNHGLEWAYRMGQEPKRMFKRYVLRDWRFLKLLWKYTKKK